MKRICSGTQRSSPANRGLLLLILALLGRLVVLRRVGRRGAGALQDDRPDHSANRAEETMRRAQAFFKLRDALRVTR